MLICLAIVVCHDTNLLNQIMKLDSSNNDDKVSSIGDDLEGNGGYNKYFIQGRGCRHYFNISSNLKPDLIPSNDGSKKRGY